ncbi:hypothetical protein GCM10027347_58600 [Larkinella harenae]
MLLYFSIISPKGESRCHLLYDSPIETHCRLLNHLVNVGYQLQFASLLSRNRKPFILPVEAFDGEEIATKFKELERQYNQVLSA